MKRPRFKKSVNGGRVYFPALTRAGNYRLPSGALYIPQYDGWRRVRLPTKKSSGKSGEKGEA